MDKEEIFLDWVSVVKGEMTPEAFVELIKARQGCIGVRTGDAMGPETVREIAKSLETHPMCTSGAASVSEDGCSVTITSTEKGDGFVALLDGAYRKSDDGSAIMMNTPNKEAVRIIFEREV